jgi:hypothetical protein
MKNNRPMGGQCPKCLHSFFDCTCKAEPKITGYIRYGKYEFHYNLQSWALLFYFDISEYVSLYSFLCFSIIKSKS